MLRSHLLLTLSVDSVEELSFLSDKQEEIFVFLCDDLYKNLDITLRKFTYPVYKRTVCSGVAALFKV